MRPTTNYSPKNENGKSLSWGDYRKLIVYKLYKDHSQVNDELLKCLLPDHMNAFPEFIELDNGKILKL